MSKTGRFVISLDFELLWGVRDTLTPESYGANILGVWESLPKMLELFSKYDVKATFATVGMLFASSKEELKKFSPAKKPQYADANLSPYNGHFNTMLDSEEEDKYHYASSLIGLIAKYPEQELSTHTFSHYYCLEDGQDLEDFRADMEAAIAIAKERDITLKSLVFPRNQFNNEYLQVCAELGIDSYRGNEDVWFHKAVSGENENYFRRGFRLIDAYFNISGHRCHEMDDISATHPYNIPSSRFLRPYSPRLRFLENLRLQRILKSMTYAAKKGKLFHLWWHPHNFGMYQEENLLFLERILQHYQKLNARYDFESLTMKAIAEKIKEKHDR